MLDATACYWLEILSLFSISLRGIPGINKFTSEFGILENDFCILIFSSALLARINGPKRGEECRREAWYWGKLPFSILSDVTDQSIIQLDEC